MLYLDRIGVSKINHVNKTNKSKEIFFTIFDKAFKFQADLCNGCHDVLMISVNLTEFAILEIYGADNRCIINEIS